MDRLRAKEPVTGQDEWSSGFISDILREESNVKLQNGVNLNLTSELIELFRSRAGSDYKGKRIWYKKKE